MPSKYSHFCKALTLIALEIDLDFNLLFSLVQSLFCLLLICSLEFFIFFSCLDKKVLCYVVLCVEFKKAEIRHLYLTSSVVL